ncbi:hypothetical protein [Qipengyuania marisflavi]|uniref:UrcA family protein n=1 Tax=Qipengyuania marisflavi TaxID=2486356 RepID=A0A5S3P597_9SPHN|nr:hypothetical protein [Qipengyuania marisflavi]TMM48187.1 hypothetical protein FEV51_07795 [Qipengyuania marisflavi]
MSVRFILPLCASIALAAPVLAQPQIDYEAGQYVYAKTADAAQDDDVVTTTLPVEGAEITAARVIPMRQGGRQAGAAPVFVSTPMIQPLTTMQPVVTLPAAAVPAPTVAVVPRGPIYNAGPVYYVDPRSIPAPQVAPPGGASRVIYPAGRAAPAPVQYAVPQDYAQSASPIPAGSQLVTFDRAAWLGACRQRLSGYNARDRAAAIAALGGAAAGYSAGRDHCEAYLDSYMNSAAAGTLVPQQGYSQQYMLVPVTVMVPQEPRR